MYVRVGLLPIYRNLPLEKIFVWALEYLFNFIDRNSDFSLIINTNRHITETRLKHFVN